MSRVTIELPPEDRKVVLALHAMWPLFERSARFGLYFWLAAAVHTASFVVVSLLTGSLLFSFAFGIFSWSLLGPAAKQAGIEREVYRWADKVNGEATK
ncbi:hypothetical protein [Stutzerimonas stutzeri]|uniref:hypothetical protein n=1 Tax=Stutzerimonas stutzeri TaxID=316 RepID=UPI000D20ABC3|nr:hypothetical protein [Stutzerimonas stutzeri]AVX13821.1 hypothetical protein CXB48_13995 [Stutzerimonas stutzeri]